MASLELTDYDAILKEHYSRQRVMRMAYEDNPLLALLPKWTKFTGRNYPEPIQYSTPQGVSVLFSQAQTSAEAGDYEAFLLTRSKYYGVATIDGETMMASQDDPGAFAEAATQEVDGILHSVTRRAAQGVYGNGGGALAQVGSTSTVTLTLKNIEDIVNFDRGMNLDSSNTDGTSGSADGGTKVVTGLDRDLGTLTAGSNWTSAGNFSNDDYIFIKGDFGGTIKGLDAWLPASAPSATAFFGVDRTADKTRLGGIRFDATALNLEDGLKKAAARVGREGGRLTHIFMNHSHWTDLELTLGAKVVRDIAKSQDGLFGFESIVMTTAKGKVKVVADHNCPTGVAYGLDINTWTLRSLGDVPMIINHDNKGMFLRQSSADGVEIRVGYYAQLGCRAPGHNVRIDLT